jgi:hypothetical protein
MDYVELNAELRDFCTKLVNDGYNKSQICSLLLGQQKLPMFSAFLESENRNFGIGVLAQIFDIFGYRLDLVPVLKDSEEEPRFTELNNRFTENYHLMLTEGLANQEKTDGRSERTGEVQQAITDIALEMFKKITNQ